MLCYNVAPQVNDMIQLFVRQPLAVINSDSSVKESKKEDSKKVEEPPLEDKADLVIEDAESEHIKLKEEVDCRVDNIYHSA